MDKLPKKKVIFCTPSLNGPTKAYIKAMEASIPLILEAGYDEGYAQEIGNVYISAARSFMLRSAITAKADIIVFIDYDMSWDPKDLLTLIETEGDVVAGTYRFKKDEEDYMGQIETDEKGYPITRPDGCIKAKHLPAGFLKITPSLLHKFMVAYPELVYGPLYHPNVDLFHHGAHKRIWYSEDYAFSRNCIDMGEDIWLLPNLNLNHHDVKNNEKEYKGNFHEFMLRRPGGSKYKPPEEVKTAEVKTASAA